MSCLDVIYHQTYGAHHHCLPSTAYKAACYQRQQRKLGGHSKTQDTMDLSAAQAQAKQQKQPQQEEEEERGAKEAPPSGAEYLSSRCVLFTYFQGDIGDVVDEHFSRALSQFGSFCEDKKRSRGVAGGLWKEAATSSADQCSGFPSPLWSSAYPTQSGPCLPPVHRDFPPAGAFHSTEPGPWVGHGLHQPIPTALPDSWHYALGAQGGGGGGYPPVHEVYPHVHARHAHPHGHVIHHGPALDPRFSPLLLSCVRPPCSPPAHCDSTKTEPDTGCNSTHHWPASFQGSVEAFDSALDPEKGKAPVWF